VLETVIDEIERGMHERGFQPPVELQEVLKRA
jgi:hypothetical protein